MSKIIFVADIKYDIDRINYLKDLGIELFNDIPKNTKVVCCG